MTKVNSDSLMLKTLGFKVVFEDSKKLVAAHKSTKKGWKKFPQKDVYAMERGIQRWCQGHKLPPERHKLNLIRSSGGNRIDEFKSYQARAYGFEMTLNHNRTFLILNTDVKKDNKADEKLLKRTGTKADEIEQEILKKMKEQGNGK